MGRLEKPEIGSTWMSPFGTTYEIRGYYINNVDSKMVIVYVHGIGKELSWNIDTGWFKDDIDISSSLMKELL